MHFSRKLMLLAAFMVGIGFVGSGELDAQARVTDVSIAAPENGDLIGIDAPIKISVEVQDRLDQDALTLYVLLAKEADKADTDARETRLIQGEGAANPSDLATRLQAALGGAGALLNEDGTALAADLSDIPNLYSVEQTKAQVDAASATTATGAARENGGDGDSLRVKANGTKFTYTWYGKLPAGANEVEAVQALAFVFDPSEEPADQRPAMFSAEAIDIDGDRPEHHADFHLILPNPAIGDTTGVVVYEGTDNTSEFLGDALAADWGPPYGGTTRGLGGTLNSVKGLGDANNGIPVAGIGDSLQGRIKLGNARLFDRPEEYQKLVVYSTRFKKEAIIYQEGVKESGTSIQKDTLTFGIPLVEGDLGADLNKDGMALNPTQVTELANSATPVPSVDTLQFFIVDPAGNKGAVTSGGTNYRNQDDPGGFPYVFARALFDTKKPVLNSASAIDTILPVTVDTISDGDLNATLEGLPDFPVDDNPISYRLDHALSELKVKFGTGKDEEVPHFIISNPEFDIRDDNLKAALDDEDTRTIDFTELADDPPFTEADADADPPVEANADSVTVSFAGGTGRFPAGKTALSTGDGDGKTFTVSFVPTDVAGNVGDPLNLVDVYVDVTDIDFVRSFPFGKGDEFSGLDTIEAGTAVVVFRLSEPADSVMINYHGITQGADADSNEVDKDRSYALSGSQLTNTTSEEKYRVPGLQHDNEYVLTVTGRDLAGNWVQDGPDTFWYNEDFVVPQAAKFVVRITEPEDRETDLKGLDKIKAGTPIGVNIEAQSVSGDNAPTYEGTATLTVGGGSGVDLDEEKSTGATDNGDGTISLNAADWVVGERDIVFTDTVSLDNLRSQHRSG